MNEKSLFETNLTSEVVEKLKKENLALKHKKVDLKKDNEKLLMDLEAIEAIDMMTNNEEIIRLENKNNNLVEQIKSIKEGNESHIDKITSIKNEKDSELAVKEVEFTEEEKTGRKSYWSFRCFVWMLRMWMHLV